MVLAQVAVVFVALYLTWRVARWRLQLKTCEKKIAEKQGMLRRQKEELEDRLKEDGVLLTAERERIVHLPVKELLQQLKDGQLKAVQVLHAFQAKALEATRRTNCVAVFISEAEEWAQELDRRGYHGTLHGLPISVKECYNITGYDSNLGLAKYIDLPAASDANLVAVLKSKGAVPFCKTNLPQTMLSYDCSNPLYGTTVHPDNPARSPGGSSGGEGALIAQRGSPLGLGSDLGGSLRIPALYCGITSLKPTSQRLSLEGSSYSKAMAGMQGLKWAVGCMGYDVDSVVTGTRALLDGPDLYQMDPLLPRLPWQEKLFATRRKLRIGYYDDDGFYLPTPGCRRAIQEAKSALERAGHELVPFTPPDVTDAIRLVTSLVDADEGISAGTDMLGGEVVDPTLRVSAARPHIPAWLLKLLNPALVMMGILPSSVEARSSSYALWQGMAAREAYIRKMVSRWTLATLDVCISPGIVFPAQPLGYAAYNLNAVTYTILYNMLDFPAGVVPVTKETEEDQEKLKDYPDDCYFMKLTKQATVGATGLPIGVQVIGLPWQEELVLQAMLELETALQQQKE